MLSSAILLDTPEQGQEILGSIMPAAERAGVTLRLFAGNDRGIEDLTKAVSTDEELSTFLIGPNLRRPLAAARKAHQLVPLVQIIFLVDPERESELQRDLSLAPMIGNDWSIASLDVDELAQHLETAARSTAQRRQLRTTLDHINLQISSWPVDNGLAHRKLIISDRYLATILAHAPVAIVSTDPRGIVTTWNLVAEQLFHLPECEAIGWRIEDIAAGQWAEALQSLMQEVQSNQRFSSREAACRRADGTTFNVDLVVAPVRQEKGGLMGISVIAHDITDRKRAHEQLKALNDNLEVLVAERTAELTQSNEDLQQFAHITSHDLREPLRAVSGFGSLLQQRYQALLDENGKEFVQHIVDGASRMSDLLDGLLVYSSVGRRQAAFEQVDGNEAFDTALANLYAAIEESNATIEHNKLPTLRCDKTQLVQLFQNLIGNAIKYRGERDLQIRVSAAKDGAFWQFSVQDSGIGFDASHGERIYEIFRRLHTRDQYSGMGVGLAICKRIVQRHGGRIWSESEPGVGSTFFFTIPEAGEGDQQ